MKEVVESLASAPEYVNEAIALAVELQQAELRGDRSAVDQAVRSGAIEKAIVAGEREGGEVLKALAACGHSVPVASKVVPVGF